MILPWRFDYHHNELLDTNKTLKQLKDEIGLDGLFGRTVIKDDGATQVAIYDYFELEHLCTPDDDKFLYYLRRNLALYYPVYKDQLDAWEKRKAIDWFYDKNYTQHTTHEGTNELNEQTADALLREVKRLMNDIVTETTTGFGDSTSNNTADSTSTNESNSNSNSEAEGTTETNGKQRSFGFNYPESNYTGGVIPYDMTNNPSVEFINNQVDTLNTSSEHTHSTGSDETTSGSTDTGHNESNEKSEFRNQSDLSRQSQNEVGEQGKDQKEGKKESTENVSWNEWIERKGDNVNALAAELLEQIPKTNFFEQFIRKLGKCFMSTEILDEIY